MTVVGVILIIVILLAIGGCFATIILSDCDSPMIFWFLILGVMTICVLFSTRESKTENIITIKNVNDEYVFVTDNEEFSINKTELVECVQISDTNTIKYERPKYLPGWRIDFEVKKVTLTKETANQLNIQIIEKENSKGD